MTEKTTQDTALPARVARGHGPRGASRQRQGRGLFRLQRQRLLRAEVGTVRTGSLASPCRPVRWTGERVSPVFWLLAKTERAALTRAGADRQG